MSTPQNSETLSGIIKAFQLINGILPILNGLFENEAERLGLTREQRYELRKSISAETRSIADDLQSDREDV